MRFFLLLVIILGSNIVAPVFATEYEINLNTSVADSNNISQTVNGEGGQTFEAGVTFRFESENIPEWEFNINGDTAKLFYSIDELADEKRVSLSALSSYTPRDTNFALDLFGNVSQAPANRFQTQEVNNLVDSEIYAVAPSYFIRMNSVSNIRVNYQYADYFIEQTEQNRNLQSGPRIEQQLSVALNRDINSSNSLSLVLQKSDTDFEDETRDNFVDFIQENIFGRWIVSNRSNQLSVEYGRYTVIDSLDREVSEIQWSFLFNRRINRYQTLNLQSFQRVSSLFSINPVTGEISVNQQNNAINQAEESKGLGALYNFNDGRINFSLISFENELAGLFESTNEVRKSNSARFSYSMSRYFDTPLERNIVFFYSQIDSDFDNPLTNALSNSVVQHSIIYEHFLSPNTLLTIDYSKREADQTLNTGEVRPVDSESIVVSFVYTLEGRL